MAIIKEIDNRTGEIYAVGRLGDFHFALGYPQKAIEYYEQALDVAYGIGYRNGVSSNLASIGQVLLNTDITQRTLQYFTESIQIADEVSFHDAQSYARCGLAQAYLFQNDLANASAIIKSALQYDKSIENYNVSVLHGIIALRQGERETAKEAFTKSIAQADEILAKTPDYYSALDAKGLALCGFGVMWG